MKSIAFSVGLLVLAPAVTFAQSSKGNADPTFNGTFENVTCRFNQMVVCDSDFCVPKKEGLLKSPVEIDFKAGRAKVGGKSAKLEVVKVAEPKFGEQLWVQTRVRHDGTDYSLQTTYIPRGAGRGYSAVGALRTTNDDGTVTMSGQCNVRKSRD